MIVWAICGYYCLVSERQSSCEQSLTEGVNHVMMRIVGQVKGIRT